MPRMKEIVDYLSNPEGDEERHSYLIDVPAQDWVTDFYIDLQPDHYVQLRKNSEGQWQVATSLPAAVNQPKKRTKKPKGE